MSSPGQTQFGNTPTIGQPNFEAPGTTNQGVLNVNFIKSKHFIIKVALIVSLNWLNSFKKYILKYIILS